jgi:epoxide hydrolase-like predicted phosphatase
MTVEAVFWDFGGVFTTSPLAAMNEYSAQLGADRDTLYDLFLGPRHVDTDHPWHRLERGELSLADAFTQCVAQVESAGISGFDPVTFFRSLGGGGQARPVVVEAVRRLDAVGVRQAVITNNVAEYSGGWRSMLPVEELFEQVIDSHEVGVRKPSSEIFEIALQALGVEPERSVFLDDLEANVEGARALGMTGIVVGADPAAALARLDGLVTPP